MELQTEQGGSSCPTLFRSIGSCTAKGLRHLPAKMFLTVLKLPLSCGIGLKSDACKQRLLHHV